MYTVGGVWFHGVRTDESSVDYMVSKTITANSLWTPDWKSVRPGAPEPGCHQPRLTLKVCQWPQSTDYHQLGWGLSAYLPPLITNYCLAWSQNVRSIVTSVLRPSYSEVQALWFTGHQISWVNEWLILYAIFLHGLAQQWRPQKKRNLAQR